MAKSKNQQAENGKPKPETISDLTTKRGTVLPCVAELAEKLRELNGNQAAVGRFYGVTRSAVNIAINKSQTLRQVCDDAREGMKDHAESSLYRALIAGESWAVCFFLKCQAKDRGYIERQEIDMTARTRLVIEEEVVGGNRPD